MKCKNIYLEYCASQDGLPETVIVIDKVPKIVLGQISRTYASEIKKEGITEFIEFEFGDVHLKFRLQNG